MPDDFQVSDPAPAPMMGVLPGRADFAPTATPEGLTRSYAEPPPVPGSAGMKLTDLKAAEEAVKSAMRFQGARAYAEDLQRGVPPDQALLKHGSKIYFGNEAGLVTSLTRLAAQKMSAGMGLDPVQTVPALDENGQPIKGTHIIRSPRGFHVLKEPPPVEAAQVKEARRAIGAEVAADLKGAKNALRKMMGKEFFTKSDPGYISQLKEVDRLQKKFDSIYSPTGAAAAPTPAGGAAAPAIEHSRELGRALLKSHPDQAEAIKARFKQQHGEDLGE